MEVEAIEDGKIGQIFTAAGTQNVKVNSPIALLLQDDETASDINVQPAPNLVRVPVGAEKPVKAGQLDLTVLLLPAFQPQLEPAQGLVRAEH